jgi:hypothetical protein
MPSIAHNPDRNEFLVIWADTSPSFDGFAVLGRIITSDSTPKGPDFVIVDKKGNQGAPKLAYVQKLQRYFIVWEDGRDFNPPPDASPFAADNDIYAIWVDSDGVPIGDDIPIYMGEGDQGMPTVAYSPVMDTFLIAWRDANAENDYEPTGPGAMMSPESKADVRGALYGLASTTTTTVPADGTGGCPAVAIYGTTSGETKILRNFRDTVLKNIPGGRKIINIYYESGPEIVKLIEQNKTAKIIVKNVVDGMLPFIKAATP